MASSIPSACTPFREDRYLPDTFVPSKDVVIIGRGRKVYDHGGNHKLRAIVQSETQAYSNAENRGTKSKIIGRIFDAIRAESQIGFVKKDPSNKKYFAVDHTTAKTTIAQCFRNQLSDAYKSSTKHKQHLREALKRSRSDCGHGHETMFEACSRRDSLRRSASADWTDFPSLDIHQDCNADPIEMQPSFMDQNTSHESAGGLWCHDPSQGIADSMEAINSSNTSEPSFMESKIPARDIFSSLCDAFDSDLDVSSDPFEPIPIKDSSCSEVPSQTKTSPTPFYMSFEEAFGPPISQESF